MDRDGQLVNALSSKQPGAPEELLGTYGGHAYRLALRITRNAADAEEVVQDAFCAIVRKIGAFRRQSAFSSWLYRIVANAAYNKLRQQPRRHREVSLDDMALGHEDDDRDRGSISGYSGDEDDPAVQNELRDVLQGAIHGLSPACRAVFVLRDVDGLSNGEISRVLGLSMASVKSRVHRARLSLRTRLADYMSRAEESPAHSRLWRTAVASRRSATPS
jgi:RNA polymerase sigma-70 factor (ECF subfamily)